jgi:hypothetical protein
MEAAHLKREKGSPKAAIWLLADSPPLILLDERYEEYEPLDWRFPTRHNIWTPIETIMNRELFRSLKKRIDDSTFYVRNAVKSGKDWKDKDILAADVAEFKRLVDEHQPFLILTFGQRAFEFACRSQGESVQSFEGWDLPKLSREFDKRLSLIREGKGILLPLLHAIIARQFAKCHTAFKGDRANYYEHVGCTLATILQGQFGNERFSELWM